MNMFKKILPFILVAIVFGIAGYFIGQTATKNQAAALYGATIYNPSNPSGKGGATLSIGGLVGTEPAGIFGWGEDYLCYESSDGGVTWTNVGGGFCSALINPGPVAPPRLKIWSAGMCNDNGRWFASTRIGCIGWLTGSPKTSPDIKGSTTGTTGPTSPNSKGTPTLNATTTTKAQ